MFDLHPQRAPPAPPEQENTGSIQDGPAARFDFGLLLGHRLQEIQSEAMRWLIIDGDEQCSPLVSPCMLSAET